MNVFWPSILNEDDAREAARRAGGFAWLVARVTTLIAIASIVLGHPIAGASGRSLLDAALFAVVGWRTWRFSFPWALAGLLLYLFEVLYGLSHGRFPGFLGIIIVLALIAGARGTAYLKRADKQTTETQPGLGA
jgi:glucose uptake protein GlcU